MTAKKKSMVGVSDILCPLLKETKFDIQSDIIYKIWNDQMTRYTYGRDITIENGILSGSKSFIKDHVCGWSERDNTPGNNSTYTLECRKDLGDSGRFKMSYFNIVPIDERWVNISHEEAEKIVDSKIALIDEEFRTYLKNAPLFVRLWFKIFGITGSGSFI